MKKKLTFTVVVLLSFLFCNAQSKNEVTILYLLPFHLNVGFENYSAIKSSAEIHQIRQFEMMGFWLSAKIALQEYEYSNKIINVIVRDVTTDINSLQKILDDSALMKSVNIIIGPFYGSLFPMAAEYAREHNIVIINPFSTRYDFVADNPSVYKLVPPFISRPEAVEEVFLSQPEKYAITLWGDSVANPELLAYKYYFTEKNIPFKEINTLTVRPDSKIKNLVIALFDKPERVIQGVHTLINNEEQSHITLVAPEKWFSISELPEDFFKLPNLYFFTNYFVEENCSKVKQFQSDYLFYYEIPALLADYSYQGYDITRYFIDLFFADYNSDAVKFNPLSYQFQWKKVDNGGFENGKARLIRVRDLELEEVRQ